MPGAVVYDLLDQTLFLQLAQNPSLIRQRLRDSDKLIVIDEIQKLPVLLNEVQRGSCRVEKALHRVRRNTAPHLRVTSTTN